MKITIVVVQFTRSTARRKWEWCRSACQVSPRCLSNFFSKSCVGHAAMECHGDRFPGRYISMGWQGHDVSYDEAREGVSRARRRPVDCGMPVCVALQENAGYKSRTLARSGRSRSHRGACLGDDGVRHSVPEDN